MKPEIIYEDDEIIVCYKPAGLAAQSARLTQPDLVSILKNHLAGNGSKPYVALTGRLDQPVEGLMAVAKNPRAAASLEKQLADHTTEKEYLAVTEGEVMPHSGRLEDYIARAQSGNLSCIAKKGESGAKRAALTYEVEKVLPAEDGSGARSLVRIRLETGRHHQIRLQFASRGYPLLGDTKYGGTNTSHPLALCACRIAFTHPKTGERMEYRAAPGGESFTGIC